MGPQNISRAAAARQAAGMQPTPRSPQIHEQPAEEDVQCDLPIRRRPQRQHQVQPIGRIEQRRLETAQERLSGVNVRVPKGQIAVPQFAKAEVPPCQKSKGQVARELFDRTLVDENNTSANIKNVNSSKTATASQKALFVVAPRESKLSFEWCSAMTIDRNRSIPASAGRSAQTRSRRFYLVPAKGDPASPLGKRACDKFPFPSKCTPAAP